VPRKPAPTVAPSSARPYLTTADVDGLGPAERIARTIVDDRRDLAPSVVRIMDAELDEPTTLRALELFRTSLQTVGDPNRDPRAAIVAAGGSEPTQ
jgi:hypothetical protein